MTFFNDGQTKIEYVEIGDAANDGKGLDLNNAGRIFNTNTKLILDWLNGGNGVLTLLNHKLPIARGGTGANSAQTARVNLGLGFADCNNVIRAAQSTLNVYNDRIVNGPYMATTGKPTKVFTRTAVGKYQITNVTKSTGFIPLLDPYGKPVFFVEINGLNATTGVLTFSTYAVVWTAAGWGKGAAVDIPANLYFNLLCE